MRAALACGVSLWIGLTGCESDPGDDFPVNPGGGGGAMGGGSSDAGIDAGDGGTLLVGRVCLVNDLRTPTTGCAATGAGDLAVTIGARAATTASDGTFAIEPPSGSNLVWRVSGPAIVTSVMPFSTELVIPAIRVETYADLLLANGVLLVEGQGSLVASVFQEGEPLAGATAFVQPPAQFATLYDGANATTWELDATGPLGAAWITGIAAGATLLRVIPPSGSAQDAAVPVEDQAITFVTIEIP